MMQAGAVLLAALMASYAATGLVRRYALRKGVLAIPNRRSSHSVPTPKGGGLAIVLVTLAGMIWMGLSGNVPLGPALAMVSGGLAVAAIGWWDDRVELPASWRLAVHLLAASGIAAASALSGQNGALLELGIGSGITGFAILVLATAWSVNLYNFMDGIDGIAGAQAVCAAIVGALLLWWSGASDWALLSAILGFASMGFLVWNWPPARVFMGDVASGFLGFTFAGLAILTATYTSLTLWPWLILLGIFVIDSSCTLVHRLILRERIFDAHRTHSYQKAADLLRSHRRVTVLVILIILVWLAPLALISALRPDWGPLVTAIAWAPLVLLWWLLRSGRTAG